VAKREVTENEYGVFMEKLEYCLKTNEDTGDALRTDHQDVSRLFKERQQAAESPYSAHIAVLRIC
jgi:hypothetical protein